MKTAYYLKLFEGMWGPEISFSRSLHVSVSMGPVLYSAKNQEVYDIVPYLNFYHVILHYFKRKTSEFGSCVGHIQIALWVNRSSESTSVTDLISVAVS